jgi:putative transposase
MKRYWSKEFGPAYFIPNTICEWKNIFIFQPYIKLVLDSWKHFQLKRAIDFIGFVIMPSHLHYIVLPTDPNYGIIEMQRDFKKFLSRRIVDGLNYELKNGVFNVMDIFKSQSVMREPASALLDFFKQIGKYSGQNYKIWMSEDKPEAIISADFLHQKLTYIHQNPVEAHFVQNSVDYPFSSARNYYQDDDSLFQITKIFG